MDSGAPGILGQPVLVHFVMILDYQRDIAHVPTQHPHLADGNALEIRQCNGLVLIQIVVVCRHLYPIDKYIRNV